MDLSVVANVGFYRYGVHFRPLTLDGIAKLEAWLRTQVLDAGFAYLYAHPMPTEVQPDYLKALIGQATELTLFAGVGLELMRRPAAWQRHLELASDGAFDAAAFAKRIAAGEPGLPDSMLALLAELRVRLNVASGERPKSDLEALEAGAKPDPTAPPPPDAAAAGPPTN